MLSSNPSILKCQIRNQSVILYPEFLYTGSRHQLAKKNAYRSSRYLRFPCEEFSLNSKKRLKQQIDKLLQVVEKKQILNSITNKIETFTINFITLTIPDTDTTYTAADCYTPILKPFLQWLQKTLKVNLYIWKAELQKRGQVHYHLLTNTWIHYAILQKKWNYLLKKNGMLNSYYREFEHYMPNSTDVHKTYNIKNLQAYLSKYMSKDNNNNQDAKKTDKSQPTAQSDIVFGNIINCLPANDSSLIMWQGKIYDCSIALKNTQMYSFEITQENIDNLEREKIDSLELGREIGLSNYFNTDKNFKEKFLTSEQKKKYADFKKCILNNQPIQKNKTEKKEEKKIYYC